MNELNVEEAVETNPLLNSRVVLVAFSPEERVLKGKAKVIEAELQPTQLPTFKTPMVAVLARSSVVEARPETARLVVVAFVVVELLAVKLVRVEDAVDKNPFKNASVVEVACSLDESFVNGKENPPAEATGHALLQSPDKQRVETARFVEVAFVVVEFCAVKFWKVEEPVTKRFDSEVSPESTLSVPVKLAKEEMVWPLMRPEVISPAINVPIVALLELIVVEVATSV